MEQALAVASQAAAQPKALQVAWEVHRSSRPLCRFGDTTVARVHPGCADDGRTGRRPSLRAKASRLQTCSAEHELGHGAHGGEVAVDEHGGGPRLAPGLEVVADLLDRARPARCPPPWRSGRPPPRRPCARRGRRPGSCAPPPRSPCARTRRSGSSSPWPPCRRCRARAYGRKPSAAASVSSWITVGAKASTSKSAADCAGGRPGEALVERMPRRRTSPWGRRRWGTSRRRSRPPGRRSSVPRRPG